MEMSVNLIGISIKRTYLRPNYLIERRDPNGFYRLFCTRERLNEFSRNFL